MPALHNRFHDALPGDPRTDSSSRQVQGALWSKALPTPVAAPRLLAHSREVLELLGLGEEALDAQVLSGNALWPGSVPLATNYGGHQFGHWAGQLGDGRAILLGELEGHELQLKGAGPTPYSRRSDGRAVLRSSVREFLCSEAMHHLGVPTTRALSLVATGEGVVRDMFYDGRPEVEPGAIVCRVARSFLRFGHFELCAARGSPALQQQLLDFTLRTYFPGLDAQGFFLEVAQRTAALMAHWQAVGFVHGVMNTDNMSVLGLTIDYGPYGWVDDFDPGWTPNTTDAQHRRYALGNQPSIGLWNVERLGEALFGEHAAQTQEGLEVYQRAFAQASSARFAAKFGLEALRDAEDRALVQEAFSWLAAEETDYTLFFRTLSGQSQAPEVSSFAPCWYREVPAAHREAGQAWLGRWWARAKDSPARAAMLRVNPKYVLRNYLAQNAIDACAAGDAGAVPALLEVLRRPFEEQPGNEAFAQKRPDWARSKPGCSALSCSS